MKTTRNHGKNTLAGKVWERLGAVRKTRSAGDIADVICFDKIPPPPTTEDNIKEYNFLLQPKEHFNKG